MFFLEIGIFLGYGSKRSGDISFLTDMVTSNIIIGSSSVIMALGKTNKQGAYIF